MLCGGTGPSQAATPEVQEMCNQLKADMEKSCGKSFTVFEVIEVRSQVVAGTNYFIKIRCGDEEFVHARVFKPLPHTNQPPQLHSCQAPKSKHDELAYF
ncbi:cystatin-B-like [Ambystoma mexicanum]|uniref:cystatin-B-like n=1 Tax=Ambystoma mexicanum TaxID=8296 RepID=UPI0037E89030